MLFQRLSPERRMTARHAAMVLVALGHAGLAVLASIDLLQFTVPTEFYFLQLAADNTLWLWVNAACAVALILAIFHNRVYRQAMSASAGFMFTWSFFNLLWGLSTVNNQPVSLAGPVLGFVLAGGSYIMAISPLPLREGSHGGN